MCGCRILLDLMLCARKYPVPHRITEEGKVIGLVSRGKEIRIKVVLMNHAGHTGRVKTKLLYFNAWYELVCITVAAPDKSDSASSLAHLAIETVSY